MAERIEDKIRDLLLPTITGEGFELVRIRIAGGKGNATLQIMAERPDGTMTIDGCEKLSRQFSILLDTYDVITGHYTLEVSSPGIDRPLTRLKDFQKWAGFESTVALKEKLDGRKKYKGIFQQPIEKDSVFILPFTDQDGKIFELPVDGIADASLILSDALLKHLQNGIDIHGVDLESADALDQQGIELSYDESDASESSTKRKKKSVLEEEKVE